MEQTAIKENLAAARANQKNLANPEAAAPGSQVDETV